MLAWVLQQPACPLISRPSLACPRPPCPAGSIEEKIWQRQLAKEGLSRVVVDDNADEQRTFSK